MFNNKIEIFTLNDKYHRDDGPAIIHPNGRQEYWLHGKPHRIDGPAYISVDGTPYWYVDGVDITDQVSAWVTEHNISWPFDDNTRTEFILRFCS